MISIIILILTSAVGILAIGGETWKQHESQFLHRITIRGWVSILFLIATIILGIFNEVTSSKEKEEFETLIKQGTFSDLDNANLQDLVAGGSIERLIKKFGKADQIRKGLGDLDFGQDSSTHIWSNGNYTLIAIANHLKQIQALTILRWKTDEILQFNPEDSNHDWYFGVSTYFEICGYLESAQHASVRKYGKGDIYWERLEATKVNFWLDFIFSHYLELPSNETDPEKINRKLIKPQHLTSFESEPNFINYSHKQHNAGWLSYLVDQTTAPGSL